MQWNSWNATKRRPRPVRYNSYWMHNRWVRVKLFQAGTTQGKQDWEALIWSKYSALADVLYIYPFKADKKTFDQDKDELGFATKPKAFRKKKTAADIERERKEKLHEEEQKIKSKI